MLADAAYAESELALNRREPRDDTYLDPAVIDDAYYQGVEDVLRWLAGDTKPPGRLKVVIDRYEAILIRPPFPSGD